MAINLSIVSCFRAEDYSDFHECQLLQLGQHAEIEIICVCQDEMILGRLERKIVNFTALKDDGKGVYPAFNKGLERVKGKYFCFFNAHDKIELQNLNTVVDVCKNSNFSILFLNGFYGSHDLSRRYRYIFKKPNNSFLLGMPNVHGATLFKNNQAFNLKFDIRYKTCADLKHLNILFSDLEIKYHCVDVDWYTLSDGGVSSVAFNNIFEKYTLYRELNVGRFIAVRHLLRSTIIKILSNILGHKWYSIRALLK